MGKFQNPFKKSAPVEGVASGNQPEVEVAIILTQFENGGPTVGYLNVGGIKTKRQATLNDMYRMCAETMQQIEAIKTADRVASMFQPKVPPPPPSIVKEKTPEVPAVDKAEGYKEEVKKEEKIS
jgi:hypothetical protein